MPSESVKETSTYVDTGSPKKKGGATKWIIIIFLIIFLIIIIGIILFFAFRPTINALVMPVNQIQTSTVGNGSDTLRVNGNAIYIGSPSGGNINLTIPASPNNAQGTVLGIKNTANPGGSSITIIPGTGVTISSGGIAAPLNVGPGQFAQFVAVSLNNYVRLTP